MMSFLKHFTAASRWRKLILAAILVTLFWLFAWYFPWQAKLHHILWLQLGVGLAIFIIPGLCVYGLLSDHPGLEFNHLTFGFVISHLMIALLGTVGRFIHVSFETISFLMMAFGLMSLLVYILPKVDRGIKFQIDRERSAYFLSTIPVLFISILVGLIVIRRVLTDDDLTYLAYLTNWQHATHLDFNDLIFGESQLVPPRFWLMSVPFAQALLAKISEMPGILILGGYYEPFLVILSVLSWYELALALKLSPRAASASVILQLTFLLLLSEYRHPGAPYFNQLSVDKATATFLLAPVFLQSLIRSLERPTRNNMFLFLLTGLSLTLMHPIAVAYAVFIGGILILLFYQGSQSFKNKLMLMTILVAILIPQIVIRFAGIPGTGSASLDPEVVLSRSSSRPLISRLGNTPFYGFNFNILAMKIPYESNIPLPEPILKWGWVLVPILAVLFALKQREHRAAQFIVSCFVLCFLAGFPFTGWIIGYFLNGRMLARSVWLFPFGISAVYLLLSIKNEFWIKSSAKIRGFSASTWPLIIITIFSTTVFLAFLRENRLPDFEEFTRKSIRYQQLATAGQALDHLMPGQAVVIGSQDLNDLLPGISWKSKIITFRIQLLASMDYFTPADREARISDTQKIFLRSTSPEDKMSLLRKYDVHFLLLQRDDLRRFNNLIANYPDLIRVTEIGGVYIVQID